MKTILIFGTIIVNLAFIAYSIFIFHLRKNRLLTSKLLLFLTLGVLLDITATTCMILGSSNGPFTLHGILGYSSLTAMLIDSIWLWKFRLKTSMKSPLPAGLIKYSTLAYGWWIVAYITGIILVAIR